MSKTLTLIGREFATALTLLVKTSTQSIDIIVYQWRLYPDQIGSTPQIFFTEIVKASRRGVSVRVLTRSNEIVSALKKEGIDARKWEGGKILHTKMCIVDSQVVVIGSHNYTLNAFNLNQEVSIMLTDEKTLKRLIDYFKGLWSL